jgi:hypothetical protein
MTDYKNASPVPAAIDKRVREAARVMAEEGISPTDICLRLGLKKATLEKWGQRGKWKTPGRIKLITDAHLRNNHDPGLLNMTLDEVSIHTGHQAGQTQDRELDSQGEQKTTAGLMADGKSGDFYTADRVGCLGEQKRGTGGAEDGGRSVPISTKPASDFSDFVRPICPLDASAVQVDKKSQLPGQLPPELYKNSQPISAVPGDGEATGLVAKFDNSINPLHGVEGSLPSSFEGFKQTLRSADQAARAQDFRSGVYRENMTAAMEKLSAYFLQLATDRPNLAIMVMPHIAKVDAIASKRFKLDDQGKESGMSDSLKLVSEKLEDGTDHLFVP